MEAKLGLVLIATSSFFLTANYVKGHGALQEPPSRSYLWRLEEFQNYDPPHNYDYHELYCGGLATFIELGHKCGLCGDPYNASIPRPNEDGGIYDAGIISRYYKSGEIIPANVILTASHLGYWQLKLCPEAILSEECFENHVLTFPEYNNADRFYVTSNNGSQDYQVTVQLPPGLKCSRCVMQWQYTAGNNFGICPNGTEGLGCGPDQETFRNCADITIL